MVFKLVHRAKCIFMSASSNTPRFYEDPRNCFTIERTFDFSSRERFQWDTIHFYALVRDKLIGINKNAQVVKTNVNGTSSFLPLDKRFFMVVLFYFILSHVYIVLILLLRIFLFFFLTTNHWTDLKNTINLCNDIPDYSNLFIIHFSILFTVSHNWNPN